MAHLAPWQRGWRDDRVAGARHVAALLGRVDVHHAVDGLAVRVGETGEGDALGSGAPYRHLAERRQGRDACPPQRQPRRLRAPVPGRPCGQRARPDHGRQRLARLRLKPQVLPLEHMAHGDAGEAGAGERAGERAGTEQRAMLVEEIPCHRVTEYPRHVRRLEEHPCARPPAQRRAHVGEQGQRVGDMLDHMAADHHVGRHVGAVRPVQPGLEPQPAGAILARPCIGRVEADAGVVRPRPVDQPAQEVALAAADFDDARAAHAAFLDQMGGECGQMRVERGRVRLRVVVVRAVARQGRVERAVEDEAAAGAGGHRQPAARHRPRLGPRADEQVLVHRHRLAQQERRGGGDVAQRAGRRHPAARQ